MSSKVPLHFLVEQSTEDIPSIRLIPSISDRSECDLEVTHGQITLSLLDDNWNEIVTDRTIQADLCHTSEMPIILGMYDFLSQGRLLMDYPANEAWLELTASQRTDEAV